MKIFTIYLPILFLLFFISCSNDPKNIDVSEIKMPEITINRLEQDIFKMDTSDVIFSTKKLEAKYGHFYTTFIRSIINNGGTRDSSYSHQIKQFISDANMRDAYTDCQKKYPTTDDLKEHITDMFKHFKHYFPNRNLPKVTTIMSGFNFPIVTVDSTLGIGLEMYLGSNSTFYKMLTLPRYKSNFMNPENIMPDATRMWMQNEFKYNMDKTDFLSEIVFMGKIIYLTDALLPDVADTLKMQYSTKQMQYCKQNEFNVWSYFAAQKLLYTTDQAEIMKFTSEGPFTTALSKESAPRIGYWIGWRIVNQYMINNPTITMEQLMNETDAQKILIKAKYKPKK
jgi:hypothetical protein